MPDKPIFDINDVVYLRESAVAGFIERYQISSIRYDNSSSQWVYAIDIKQRGPAHSTVLDRVDLTARSTLEFRQSELLTFCEAMEIAIIESEKRLERLRITYSQRCGGSTNI